MLKRTKEIILNALELEISEAHVESKGRSQRARVRLDAKKSLLFLSIPEPVFGDATIRIAFSGIHNDKMAGFYRSGYLDGSKEKFMLSTQFEPADARRCFPCFDEPELKASFAVSMTVDSGLECISNMPIKSELKMAGGKKKVSFQETPRMSSYLLYLGVGNFERTSGSVGDIRLSVMSVPGRKKLTSLPLTYAKESLAFYNKYFGIKYPLPKLDLIAVPDFAAGAMENWGAITARELRLLSDERSSMAVKQDVAELIAHEITHQWFGDLVTMKWWDDLWLNESFATYLSHKALSDLFPEWEMEKQVLSDTPSNTANALSADQLSATHPISVVVNSPGEVDSIFDAISYDKGGAILSMIEDYAGKEAFRKGLHEYLRKHSYSNATKYDLWESIDTAAKGRSLEKTVSEFTKCWINTAGYPVIRVRKSRRGVTLTQKRFMMSGRDEPKGRWLIPVSYFLGSGKEGALLFSSRSKELELNLKKERFIKLNRGQKGFYRVWYDGGLLAEMGNAIIKGEIDDVDAWGVENDLFAFARSGKIPLKEYLSFVSDYCLRCGYPVNSNLLSHLNFFYALLPDSTLREEVKEVLSDFCGMLFGSLGFKEKRGDSATDAVLRGSVIATMGRTGNKKIIGKARSAFDSYLDGKIAMTPNMKGAILNTVATNGDRSVFNIIKKLYLSEKNPEDKTRFLRTLGAFRGEGLVRSALEFALSEKVKYQDAVRIPVVAASNPSARRLLLRWTLENWKTFQRRYPSGTHMRKAFASLFNTQTDGRARDEITAFFRRKGMISKDMERELRMSLETISANMELMRVNGLD